MMFPLAVALAYLDAIAKTWLAIGEKLNSICGNVSSPLSSSESSSARPVCQAGGPSKQRKYPGHHLYNRLEFSLRDFLRSKMQDPLGGESTSSARNFSKSGKVNHLSEHSPPYPSNGQVCTPGPGKDEAFSTGTATQASSWSYRLRLARKPRPLPPSTRPRATDKTLVLDLDETLIHARKHIPLGDGRFDFMVVLPPRMLRGIAKYSGGGENSATTTAGSRDLPPLARSRRATWTRWKERGLGSLFGNNNSRRDCRSTSGLTTSSGAGERRVYVRKRPHLDRFLRAVSEQFEVVVFTAARADFAAKVLEEIDPNREMVDHILSRESCTRLMLSRRKHAAVVKDLGIIGRPLSKVSVSLLGDLLHLRCFFLVQW